MEETKTENFFDESVQIFEAENRIELANNWLSPENPQSSYREFVLSQYRTNKEK